MSPLSLEQIDTPALLLDEARMERNMERMREQVRRLGVSFRPHVKTHKCMEVARRTMATAQGPITVSTLREAEYFAQQGVKDILYAVCIAPNKLAQVAALQDRGVAMSIILDSVEAARFVAEHAARRDRRFDVLIEVDSDGHRSGVKPDADELIAIAQTLERGGLPLKGVMTHAGSSYDCDSVGAIRAMAEQERAAIVHAAGRLRAAGMACPVVSLGSTPTALFAEHLAGVTELRAGVYVFFDLVMAGLQVCRVSDLALSVLATVIGHQREKGWTLLDAGWMAMSRDRGTAKQAIDQGYGVVCDLDGNPLEDFILIDANQEHGVMARRSRSANGVPHLPVGTQVRILPNHACSTAAQYGHYNLLGADREVKATWQRFSGW